MTTANNDAFQSAFNIEWQDGTVTINAASKRNLTAIIVGAILSFVFFTLANSGFGGVADVILFVSLGIASIYVAYRMNSRGHYPTSVLDFRRREITRMPELKFMKDRIHHFRRLKGISMGTKAVSGHTSAYEEGNTDYRKSIILETDSGEFVLLTYYSRSEQTEESASRFVDRLKEKLTSIAE